MQRQRQRQTQKATHNATHKSTQKLMQKQFISLENQNFISTSRSNSDKITATREQGGSGCQTLQKWYPHIRGR